MTIATQKDTASADAIPALRPAAPSFESHPIGP
jgi:hypothetical protein